MSLVALQMNEGAALIRINNPPVNALSADVRAGLWEAIGIAETEARVGAIVLLSGGAMFSAGADIKEFKNKPTSEAPSLGALCRRIETCTKPVVAGLHGKALGGGLELAMAAHFRLAEPDAEMGLPEIKLGLLPGAGGTQRLPRLVGAKLALQMMLRGRPVSALTAERAGLIDGRVKGNLQSACVHLARELAETGAEIRRTCDRRDAMTDPAGYQAEVDATRKSARSSIYHAPHRILDCVEAAQILPIQQGLIYEAEAFAELAAGAQARALQHMFFAERRKRVSSEVAEVGPAQLSTIAVAGAGPRGAPVVAAALRSGMSVRILEQDTTYLAEGERAVSTLLQAEVSAKRLTEDNMAQAMSRLQGATSVEDLGPVEVIVETLADASDLKVDLLAGLAQIIGPQGVVATLSDAPEISALAGDEDTRNRLIGLRFGGEAHRARVVEIACDGATSLRAEATGVALAKAFDLMPVLGQGPVVPALWNAAFQASRQIAPEPQDASVLAGAFRALGFGLIPVDAQPVGRFEKEDALLLIKPVMLAMANAGADALLHARSPHAMDIDILSVLALGCPRWIGGPMHWSSEQGLLTTRDALAALYERFGAEVFRPSPVFAELGRASLTFADMD